MFLGSILRIRIRLIIIKKINSVNIANELTNVCNYEYED